MQLFFLPFQLGDAAFTIEFTHLMGSYLKDRVQFCKDLKLVYKAINKELALEELEKFKEKWQKNTNMLSLLGKKTGTIFPTFLSIHWSLER